LATFEAAKHVCAANNSIKQYLGGKVWSIGDNKRLRHVHDKFSDSAVVGKIKTGRGGLAVTITNTNPLTIAKSEKPSATPTTTTQTESKESSGQVSQRRGLPSLVSTTAFASTRYAIRLTDHVQVSFDKYLFLC
jgi:hypothetical protein